MSRYKTHEAGENGYTEWVTPVEVGYKMSCCDCGLVHSLDFRVTDDYRVQFRVRRNERSTGQVRRHMKNGD